MQDLGHKQLHMLPNICSQDQGITPDKIVWTWHGKWVLMGASVSTGNGLEAQLNVHDSKDTLVPCAAARCICIPEGAAE